jgi:hypothetical protein
MRWWLRYAQVCPIVPYRVREVSSQGIDKDFVLIELEDDIGKPPISFALHALAVARRFPGWGCMLEGSLDDIRDLHSGRK